MKCPYCSEQETKVLESRANQTHDMIRRRRECPVCEGRFTTYEKVEVVMPAIVKKDGRREPYNREKLFNGLSKACQKRPVTTAQIEGIIEKAEKRLQSFGVKEIPSRTLGQMLMLDLLELDKVAYVRFASVYREFKDVEEFVEELKLPIQDSSGLTDGNILEFDFDQAKGPNA